MEMGRPMTSMTSEIFKWKAIRAVADTCEAYYHEKTDLSEVQLVWYAHILGNKKAILIVPKMRDRIFEVTWNNAKEEMYVDGYEKAVNAKIVEEKEFEAEPGDVFVLKEQAKENE